jgi:hypothetical protein
MKSVKRNNKRNYKTQKRKGKGVKGGASIGMIDKLGSRLNVFSSTKVATHCCKTAENVEDLLNDNDIFTGKDCVKGLGTTCAGKEQRNKFRCFKDKGPKSTIKIDKKNEEQCEYILSSSERFKGFLSLMDGIEHFKKFSAKLGKFGTWTKDQLKGALGMTSDAMDSGYIALENAISELNKKIVKINVLLKKPDAEFEAEIKQFIKSENLDISTNSEDNTETANQGIDNKTSDGGTIKKRFGLFNGGADVKEYKKKLTEKRNLLSQSEICLREYADDLKSLKQKYREKNEYDKYAIEQANKKINESKRKINLIERAIEEMKDNPDPEKISSIKNAISESSNKLSADANSYANSMKKINKIDRMHYSNPSDVFAIFTFTCFFLPVAFMCFDAIFNPRHWGSYPYRWGGKSIKKRRHGRKQITRKLHYPRNAIS